MANRHEELVRATIGSLSTDELSRPCMNISTCKGPLTLAEHIEKFSADWRFHSGFKGAIETPMQTIDDMRLYIKNYIVGMRK